MSHCDENKKLLDKYINAAEQGNIEAQLILGEIYNDEANKEYDSDKAFYWYMKATGQGDADAQFQLGNLYRLGECAEEEMIDWYTKAAEQGGKYAQEWLQKRNYRLPKVID